jgi:hypothetical protein
MNGFPEARASQQLPGSNWRIIPASLEILEKLAWASAGVN